MHPNDGRVVSNFIVQALKDEPITIYGDGNPTRSFCYVDDRVDGLMRLMNSDEALIGPVNPGNPGEFTILGLARKIIEITGSKSKIDHESLPRDDPRQRKPDIGLAEKELQWAPQIALTRELEKTITYFDKLMQA